MNTFLGHYEPVWLFAILSIDVLLSVILIYFAIRQDKWAKIEFDYDKAFNDRVEARKLRRNARKKDKVDPFSLKDMD